MLIEARIEELDEAITETQRAMAAASRAVLGGFALRSSPERIVWPDRYSDPRGVSLWRTVLRLLDESGDGSTVDEVRQ